MLEQFTAKPKKRVKNFLSHFPRFSPNSIALERRHRLTTNLQQPRATCLPLVRPLPYPYASQNSEQPQPTE
jgi:hypothetical protein